MNYWIIYEITVLWKIGAKPLGHRVMLTLSLSHILNYLLKSGTFQTTEMKTLP